MAKKSIEGRLTVVERLLKTAKGVIKEIYIEGGLSGPGIAVRARIDRNQFFEGEAGEDFVSFQNRMRAIAEAERAEFIVYGGLPPNPLEWLEPPGLQEALAKAAWSRTDEIDANEQ